MNFISGAVSGCEQEGPARTSPTPAMDFLTGTLAQGVAEEDGQDGVLGHVGALAENEINLFDLVVGEIGPNPTKKRHDEPGAMLRRADSRGHVENQGHPDHHHQPVFEENFQVRQ